MNITNIGFGLVEISTDNNHILKHKDSEYITEIHSSIISKKDIDNWEEIDIPENLKANANIENITT